MNCPDLLRFERDTLQNGVEAYTNLSLPIPAVLVAVMFHTGSFDDPPGKSGLAHFMEHMPFRGTERYPSNISIAKPIEDVGGYLNAYTSTEKIVFCGKTSPDDVALLADVLGDMTERALNREVDVELERGIIVEEWKSAFATSHGYAWKIYRQELFRGHPQARLTIGELSDIRSCTAGDIRGFYDRVCRKSALTLFALGGADKDSILCELESAFGKRLAPPRSDRESLSLTPELGRKVVIADQPYPRTHLIMGAPAFPARNHAEVPAARVLAAMLGTGFSSPLFMELREKRGLVYSFSFYYEGSSTTGEFLLSASTSFANVEKVAEVFFEAVERVSRDTARLHATKQLLVKYQRMKEPVLGRMLSDAADAVVEGGHDPISREEDERLIMGVTLEDVERLAAAYLQPERFLTVVVKSQTE